jgi:hypothetical protein
MTHASYRTATATEGGSLRVRIMILFLAGIFRGKPMIAVANGYAS